MTSSRLISVVLVLFWSTQCNAMKKEIDIAVGCEKDTPLSSRLVIKSVGVIDGLDAGVCVDKREYLSSVMVDKVQLRQLGDEDLYWIFIFPKPDYVSLVSIFSERNIGRDLIIIRGGAFLTYGRIEKRLDDGVITITVPDMRVGHLIGSSIAGETP